MSRRGAVGPGTRYARSADGVLYRVQAVGPRWENGAHTEEVYADLMNPEGDELSLPVAELTPAAPPSRQRPPIEGMPAARPACAYCARPVPMWTDDTAVGSGNARRILRRVWSGWRGYGRRAGSTDPLFCRLRCALWFAEAAARAGYVMERQDKGGE